MLFTALAGALIAVPVWLATRAVGGSAGTAWIAALIIETLPAHLHRTFGYWVRYDALGGLLIAAHVAFVLRALRPTATRRLDAVAALLLLIAAAGTWRVSLVVPPLEAAWALAVIVARGAERPVREWMVLLGVGGTIAFAMMDPMRAQQFTRSGAWLFVLGAAAACSSPTSRESARIGIRLATALAVVAAALAAARALETPAYAGTFELLMFKLRQLAFGAS